MIGGLLGRLKSALGRVAVAVLLIVAATAVQFWNEGRSLRQQRLLDAAAEAVVEVSAERPHADNEGRLVHLRGSTRADQPLLDADLGQPAEGLALRRTVEMYQWHERRESTGDEGSGHRRMRYRQDWADEPIDHRRFEQPAGHENPDELPIESRTWHALAVTLGGFRLADEVVRQIDGWRPMAADPERLPENLSMSLRSDGEYLTTVDGDPRIGDLRIRFERIPDGPVSLIAEQRDGWLQPWTHNGRTLLLVERGNHSADALLAAAATSNHRLAWVLRLVGFAALWVGFGMLLGPLTRAFGRLPLAGRALRFASATLSGLLSGLLSFVAIGSGFLFHRPWLLFAALALLAAVVALAMRRRARRSAAGVPPPPPPAVPVP